jgi:uncharacterized C2H2 Zn-finger protein
LFSKLGIKGEFMEFGYEVEIIIECPENFEVRFKNDKDNRYTRWIDKRDGYLFFSHKDKKILNFKDEELQNICLYCYKNNISLYFN